MWLYGGYTSYYPYINTDGVGSGPGAKVKEHKSTDCACEIDCFIQLITNSNYYYYMLLFCR